VVGVAANRRQHQGAADPELGLLRITDTQNRTLGVLLNFACHPTSLDHRNRLISADYPGYAAIAVARAVGSWAACATGAAADVGPADRDPAPVSPLDEVSAASVRPHSEEGDPFVRAERLGHALADEGLRCLGDTPAEHLGPVAVATEKLSLPLLQTPTRAQLIAEVTRHGEMLATATIAGRHGEARIHRAMRSWAEETLAALEGDVAPHAVAAEVQVIRAGPVVLVGVPGECFVELGIAVKEALAGHPVLILSCANGNVGYIPTRSAYAEGGYEIDEAFKYYGYPAALAPEAGELVVDSAIRLAGQLLAED